MSAAMNAPIESIKSLIVATDVDDVSEEVLEELTDEVGHIDLANGR
jgi:hypothetical protein